MKNGFHSFESSDSEICVSTAVMDAARRITQSKTTKGWLNPPYNRFGCLRVSRKIQTVRDSTKKLKTQTGKQGCLLHPYSQFVESEIPPVSRLLGSVRLEIRRVSGHICNDQVYWMKGKDDDGICVFDPDGIKVIDDVEQEKPPYIIFEFKFREDPKITQITQRMTEENAVDTKIGVRTPNKSLETARKGTSSVACKGNHLY